VETKNNKEFQVSLRQLRGKCGNSKKKEKQMKNIVLKSTLSLAVIATLFSGCGKEAPKPQTQVQAGESEADFRCRQDGVLAPKWTCDPYVEGAIAAVGIAKRNAGNDKSMQRSEAMADGRDALSFSNQY
jgi:hypothetical protein